MGGIPDLWTQPPTTAQLISLCAETASIDQGWGWREAGFAIQSVMTYTEAAPIVMAV